MESLDFREIVSLVNYSRTTSITSEPAARDESWTLHAAENRVHTARFPFTVINLQSTATRKNIEDLFINRDSPTFKTRQQHSPPLQRVHLVYAETLKQRIPKLKELLDTISVEQYTLREYLSSYVKDETEKYITQIKQIEPRYYVDPPVQAPVGMTFRARNPLLNFMLDTDEKVDGKVAVLLADPGQGKTFTASHVASSLIDSGIIPIYVDSKQWKALGADDLGSLAKTILNSFKHFEATIPWVDGHEEEFLRTALKARLFRIIFDGFDEYVLWNRGAVSAADTIRTVCSLAETTGTRVVLTSRTSFWDSDVQEDRTSEPRLLLYRLQPFEKEHAEGYFAKRLEHDASLVGEASSLYVALQKQEPSLVGRGFVLNLIAGAVEVGSRHAMLEGAGTTTSLEWLVEAFCEREKERQQLALNGRQQTAGFRSFAAELACGQPATTDLLEYSMIVANSDVEEAGVRDAVRKMRSHPLLTCDAKSGQWSFRYEQIETVLAAGRFLDCLAHPADLVELVRKVMLNDGTQGADLAEMLAELAVSRIAARPSIAADLVSGLTAAARQLPESERRLGLGHGLPTAVAAACVDLMYPKGAAHKERAVALIDLFPGKELRDLTFVGALRPLRAFDFRGTKFRGCRFEHQEWFNCEFDDTTVFSHCVFIGGDSQHCRGLGRVDVSDHVSRDEAAAVWISRLQIQDGKKQYTRVDLEADLRAILRKFAARTGFSLKSVEHDVVLRGAISASRHKDAILAELLGAVLERHNISGVHAGGLNVRESAADAVRFLIANNVLTGPLEDVANRIQLKLRIPAGE